MPLVQYSDSDSDSGSPEPPPPAKKTRHNAAQPSSLPPLPATFRDLYATNSRVSVQDDPSLHGGRKRAIPHVEGNWPSHLYLEWYPTKRELATLQELLQQVSSRKDRSLKVQSLLHSDLGAQLPLHISLSRSLVLRTEQRSSFIELLSTKVKESGIYKFQVKPDILQWVSNYERTRWFLVLHVEKPPEDNLNRLLYMSNGVVGRFNQPPLYTTSQSAGKQSQKDHSDYFHISIAWSLTEPSPEEYDYAQNIDIPRLLGFQIGFDCIKAKDDLGAFQASHFGHRTIAHPQPDAVDTAPEVDEDLGYYEDGVKRTITDEQIRIFRHSEIHALLRERELEQEDSDDGPLYRDSEDTGEISGDDAEGTRKHSENSKQTSLSSNTRSAKYAEVAGGDQENHEHDERAHGGAKG